MSRLDLNSLLQPTSNTYGVSEVSSQGVNPSQNATASPIVSQPDQTSLSQAAGLIAQNMSGSDVRTAKVAALQQAIQAGTYNVSASDVADKMMGNLLRGNE